MTENKRFYMDKSGDLYDKENGSVMVDFGYSYDGVGCKRIIDLLNELNDKNKYLESNKPQKNNFIKEVCLNVKDEFNYALELNKIYEKEGFDGIIDEVEDTLKYGNVTKKNGLYCITTGGWSEDEFLVNSLISPLSKFHYHYCGYIVGGAFYFVKDRSNNNVDIVNFDEKR